MTNLTRGPRGVAQPIVTGVPAATSSTQTGPPARVSPAPAAVVKVVGAAADGRVHVPE